MLPPDAVVVWQGGELLPARASSLPQYQGSLRNYLGVGLLSDANDRARAEKSRQQRRRAKKRAGRRVMVGSAKRLREARRRQMAAYNQRRRAA